ncbi:MAG: hypothetical protein IT207_05275 [Fimbriimonadaceae bacterium]|nr:hypothetical protein [Fimbriimonadaceae bacterium]
MEAGHRDRWIALGSITLIVLSAWLYWVLPRSWAKSPVQVDTDFVAPVP